MEDMNERWNGREGRRASRFSLQLLFKELLLRKGGHVMG
jgi:hypothetical protein